MDHFSPALFARFCVAILTMLWSSAASAQPGVSLYTIPVVFHVLHVNGSENISDEQIQNAMDRLNMNFDAPTWPLLAPFDTIAADMDVHFELANTAPDGSPTSGIDRIYTPLSYSAGSPDSYLSPWPRNHYLNVWTVHDIDVFGAAFLSGRPEDMDDEPCSDGVMILHDYTGTIGTGNLATGRNALTRAVARFFNLKYLYEDTIGGGPCGDDDVFDTPSCVPETICQDLPNSCSAEPLNFQNFMYSPYCAGMFTEGQRTRVHACLNDTVAQRNELASGIWSTSPDCSPNGMVIVGAGISSVQVRPSVFTDEIVLDAPARTRYQVELNDLGGRRILAFTGVMAQVPFAVPANLISGSYVLIANDGERRVAVRVVKQ